ncbi:DHHA1 domain-containing protein [Thermoproteota archaeon]
MEEYTGVKGKIVDDPSVLVRMHTGEHVLFKALQNQVKDAVVEKIDLNENESSFFVIAHGLQIDHILEAEKLANKIIKEDRKVKEYFVPKDDAEALKELRIRIERIKEDTVRGVEVEDFDKAACSGDHVSHTELIGGVLVTRFNSLGKDRYEIRFKISYQDDLFEFSRIARQVKDAAGTDYPMLVSFVRNAKEENAKLKEKVRELSANVAVDVKKEQIKDFNFYYATFPGINKKQFIEKINAVDDERLVVVFVNKDERNTIAIRTNCLDANAILQELFKEIEGKGGGNDKLAQGSFAGNTEEVIEKIKKIIN